MILCDDLGYGDLGCYGNRIILTPNVDRLAAHGTRFTQFYMTPSCSPSRSSFMTGQYPQRYNVQASDLPESRPRYGLPPSAFTIGKALQAAGYYTAHVGKWHVGEPPMTVAPRKQGFDYFFGGFGGRPSSPWSKYSRSMDPEMIENENRPVVFKGHVTAVETDAAVRVLSRMTKDRPFFLNLCYNSPHEPLAPLSYQKELYESWSAPEQTYFQTVTDLDRGIGRVLKTLEEFGFSDNTLIVLSSDNGPEKHSYPYSRGSAGPLRGMKATLWEGGIRVPCILHWPGAVPAGGVSTEVASVLDLFPTFCTAAGAPVPKNLDGGIDLVAVAKGRKPAAERDIFVEYHMPQRVVPPSLPMMMRTGKWKLFSNHRFETFELYDLDADVGEQHNVAAEHPEVVRSMRRRLEAWWSEFAKMDVSGVRTSVPTPTPEELDKTYYKN